jgi:hypothetical protein
MNTSQNPFSYSARPLGLVGDRNDSWGHIRVGVFRNADGTEEQIGEYTRNYGNFYETFFAFESEDRSYALYSPDYAATRIMELPSCRDYGEDSNREEFCPVAYFVPAYVDQEMRYSGPPGTPYAEGQTIRRRKNNASIEDLKTTVSGWDARDLRTDDSKPYRVECKTVATSPLTFYPFGFVAGCIWGDDSSWKVQYLDLSGVTQGVIKRDHRFGYVELPHGMKLSDAILLDEYQQPSLLQYDDEAHCLRIINQQRFDIRTGKQAPP